MKTEIVTLSGGFHNAGPINVKVPKNFDPVHDCIIDVLGQSVIKKLDRHFCGINGCTCGGVFRATAETQCKRG